MFSICSPNKKKLNPLESQLFTFAYSVAMSRILNQNGYKQKMIAGFSLGVYAALCAIDVVSIDDGLGMVKRA